MTPKTAHSAHAPPKPGPYEPWLGGGAFGEPGLSTAVPGVRTALRPESQVQARHHQLPPSSRVSQMDPRSVPWWKHAGDKQCQVTQYEDSAQDQPPPATIQNNRSLPEGTQIWDNHGVGKGKAIHISSHWFSCSLSPWALMRPFSVYRAKTLKPSVTPHLPSLSKFCLLYLWNINLPRIPLLPTLTASAWSSHHHLCLDNHSCLFTGLAASSFAPRS